MKAKVTELVKKADVLESRGTNDTIRLWENYREQASLWRAVSLLQMPATIVALIFAALIWIDRKIILNVPQKPLPGIYQAQDIPDSEFLDAATNFINLIATYQPAVARRQFGRAHELVVNPLLARFNQDFMLTELKTIENTERTQVFFIDPSQTRIERSGNLVIVTVTGDRMKVVAGKELDPVITRYQVAMQTIPRNDLNPYGIVVTDMAFENVKGDDDRHHG